MVSLILYLFFFIGCSFRLHFHLKRGFRPITATKFFHLSLFLLAFIRVSCDWKLEYLFSSFQIRAPLMKCVCEAPFPFSPFPFLSPFLFHLFFFLWLKSQFHIKFLFVLNPNVLLHSFFLFFEPIDWFWMTLSHQLIQIAHTIRRASNKFLFSSSLSPPISIY